MAQYDPSITKDPRFNQLPPEKQAEILSNLAQGPASAPGEGEMTPQQFTAERQRSAVEEPMFQKAAGAVIPTLAAAAGFAVPATLPIRGAGHVANLASKYGPTAIDSLIGGGAAVANQKLGFEPESKGQVALAAGIPWLARGAIAGAKVAGKMGGELVAPGVLKEAGTEAVAQAVGAPTTSAERIMKGFSSSKRLYEAAQRVQTPVPIQNIKGVVSKSLLKEMDKANPEALAVKHLKNLRTKYSGGNVATTYDDVLEEVQSLRSRAKGIANRNPNAAARLRDTADEIIEEMDKTNTIFRAANTEYLRLSKTQELVDAMRSSNPGVNVRKMLEENPEAFKRAFQLKSTRDVNALLDYADAIADVPGAASVGIGRQLWGAMVEPATSALTNPAGRALLRQVVKPTGATKKGRLTLVGLSTLAQFGRAYAAQ